MSLLKKCDCGLVNGYCKPDICKSLPVKELHPQEGNVIPAMEGADVHWDNIPTQEVKGEKEKAKELIDKFYKELEDNDCYVTRAGFGTDFEYTRIAAKQCALIAVDMQIELLTTLLKYDELKNNFFLVDGINDLEQVKQSINNIK